MIKKIFIILQPYQQFYPGVIQPWPPGAPYYADIGSVFSVNGIPPQGNFKQTPYRTNTRPRNKQRNLMQQSDNSGSRQNNMHLISPASPQSQSKHTPKPTSHVELSRTSSSIPESDSSGVSGGKITYAEFDLFIDNS